MPSLGWLRRHGAPESDRPIKLIVGLGNPGAKYAHSRHNVGFMVVDRLAHVEGIAFSRRRFNALLAEGEIGPERVIVAKPQTFMNSSGVAVGKLFGFYKVRPEDLIVIYDDLDLPLGKTRLRTRGSAGGHHGMESIIAAIGTSEFPRLRIGIGRPNPDADIDHVLSPFTAEEDRVIKEAIERAAKTVEVWLSEGITLAMNRFNSQQA
jgi:PTH1 family peptidyl-tRNA hydrolase